MASEDTRVALRVGDWKIIGSDDLKKFQLYNIRDDAQEKNDLAVTHPDKLQELRQQLIAHDAAVLKEGPNWWQEVKPV